MLPERGAGLGLGSNYGLRCPLARAGDPNGEAPAQAERRVTAARRQPSRDGAVLTSPHRLHATRTRRGREHIEAAVRRQRGRIGGGIEPERQDAQVSAELTGEACGRIELEAGCTQQRSWPTCEPKARREPAQS